MKVILFGATGMVGQGVLRECLLDPDVDGVLVIGRASVSRIGVSHPKLRERLLPDLAGIGAIESDLAGYDACFFCLGVTSAGMTEAAYRHVTYDLTMAAATAVLAQNPGMTFVFVSGRGTDSTEQGRSMWARVKGKTENALLRMPFKAAYMFRPAIIRAVNGEVSRTRSYRVLYALLGWWLMPIIRFLFPRSVTTTQNIGRAMLLVTKHGASRPVIESWDIDMLAAAVPKSKAAA